MKVEQNLPIVRERKLAILKGDPGLCAEQKKAGKLLARERIALTAASRQKRKWRFSTKARLCGADDRHLDGSRSHAPGLACGG